MGLEAAELARWTRFAAKGGIGRGIATCDCVAESADDLMFLKDDEITVLLQLQDREGYYLGYCEGVVGRFSGADVRFVGKLKKPVMTKRISSAGSTTSPTASNNNGNTNNNTNTQSPSPSLAMSPSPTSHFIRPTSSSIQPPSHSNGPQRQSPVPASSAATSMKRASSTPSPVAAASALRSLSASSTSYPNTSTTQRTRTASLERRGSPSAVGGHGSSQRYLASPLSGSSSLAAESDSEFGYGSGSGSGSGGGSFGNFRRGWMQDDDDEGRGNAFATLHEVALAEAGTPTSQGREIQRDSGTAQEQGQHRSARYGSLTGSAYTSSPLGTPSPSETHFPAGISGAHADSGQAVRGEPAGFASRAGSMNALAPSSPPTRVNSPPHSITSPSSPPSQTSSPAIQPGTLQTSPSGTPPTSPPTQSASLGSPPTSPPRGQQPAHQPHRYTAHAPSPLTLHRELPSGASLAPAPAQGQGPLVSPLRINKRSPGPIAGFSGTTGHVTIPAPRSPPPTSALPVVPASPPASARGGLSAGQAQTLVLPPTGHASGGGLSPSTAGFSPSAFSTSTAPSSASVYSVPSMYSVNSSPVPPASPAVSGSLSARVSVVSPATSSPSHPATFAHRLGLNSVQGSPAYEDGFGTVGSSPSTLVHEDVEGPVAATGRGQQMEKEANSKEMEVKKAKEKTQPHNGSNAAAGVSIGLSLLEGLIGSYSDSDSGSDYGDEDDVDGMRSARRETFFEQSGAQSARHSVAASEDSTVEGLGYARSEEEHTQVAPPPLATPPPVQGQQPPAASAPEPHFLSQPTSPTSPGFPERGLSQINTRASIHSARSGTGGVGVAADARSARSVRSDTLSSWEGDIYDNYRYSRASGSVRSGGESVRSGIGGGGAESVRSFGAFTPGGAGERRPSFDSVRSGGWRERVDSGARRLDGLIEIGGESEAHGASELGHGPAEVEADEQATPVDQEKRTTISAAEVHARRMSKKRTPSVDSDASVYTQNSRLSTLSRDLALGGVLAGIGSGNDTHAEAHAEPNDPAASAATQPRRPPPLALATSAEPLLHTSWGSPLSSPGQSTGGLSIYTPVAGVLDNQGRPGYAYIDSAMQSSQVEEGPKSPNTMAGFASAMRMRLEEDRIAAEAADKQDDENGSTRGLGHRIVVEDDEELPSRIVNSTYDSQADTSLDADADASYTSHSTGTSSSAPTLRGANTADSSPEPDLLGHLGSRLAPLVVANRTPSPSLREGGSDDVRPLLILPEDQPPLPPSSPSPSATHAAGPSPSPSLSPSPSQSPSPSHLRPSLAELRAPGGAPVPGTNQRRSLFLPHPNAPKAPEGLNSPGPMYIAAQQGPSSGAGLAAQGQGTSMGPTLQPGQFAGPGQIQQQQQRAAGPPRPSVFAAIHMALSLAARPPPNAGAPGAGPRLPPRGPTIYGRTESDLAGSLGPVPIVFGVEPPRATAPPPGQAHGPPHGQSVVQTKGPRAGAPPTSPPRVQMMAKGGGGLPRSMSLGPGVSAGSRLNPNADAPPPSIPQTSLSVPGTTEQTAAREAEQKPGSGPVPRANFFPKAAGLRPRSRSFSGFNTGASADIPVPKRSREDAEMRPRKDVQRALTSSVSSLSLSSSPTSTSGTSITNSSISLSSSSASSASRPGSTASSKSSSISSAPARPSPLSLSHLRTSAPALKPSISSPTLKPPSSPLAQSVITGPLASSQSLPTSTSAAGNAGPTSGSTVNGTANDGGRDSNATPPPQRRATDERASLSAPSHGRNARPSAQFDGLPPAKGVAQGRTASLLAPAAPRTSLSQELKSTHSMMDLHTASRNSTSSNSDAQPQISMSPPPAIGRQSSLRSKLSLPNLRRKHSRAEDDNLGSPTASGLAAGSPPTNSTLSGLSSTLMHDPEMLQVKDMEFELVRPNLALHFSQAARTSEDSGVLGRDGSFDMRQDTTSFLRADSPAFSVSSSTVQISGGRSPTAMDSGWTPQTSINSSSPGPMASNAPPVAAESSIEAHRSRELKWMSLMAANPAAQARKSKKVRKLLTEGVPSSVRYLVWTYLTDGKARCVPGVYTQLCARGRVGVAGQIEEDVRVGFVRQGEEHLQGTKGSVLSLLSAYLNMVPDLQYSMGLTLIVGQLLLLAPEEDAFWIFVSIMDTHIRPYFSPSTTQMDVDAALFSRALENNDSQVARKIFVDMGILPPTICGPWFSTLFVGTLPPEHLNRTWDLFLFEGVPFLLRVGIVVMQCCRRGILEATSDGSVLQLLRHPPPSLLPPTPDAFLALVFSVKLKDDDMRKQRVKMEAQVKRQTQVPRAASTSGMGMISLPRA